MIIDAHLHVWSDDTDKYPWNPIGGYIPERSASIDDFKQRMGEFGVDKAVIVQPTLYGWDNSYLMDVCRREKDRFKAVVLVNPETKKSCADLRKLIDEGANGLRVNLHLLSVKFLRSDDFHALIDTANELEIPVCFQLIPKYFDEIKNIFRQYPKTRFILDHMARPKAGAKPEEPGSIQFLDLSKFSNVYVKLSGLNYFSNQSHPYKDTWPLLKAALAQFSMERCMWGSDYPFVNDHWSYRDSLETFRMEIGFSEVELSWLLGKTADSIWWRK